jgi:hypothetical protein
MICPRNREGSVCKDCGNVKLLDLTSGKAVHRWACRYDATPAASDTSPGPAALRKECSGGPFARMQSKLCLRIG